MDIVGTIVVLGVLLGSMILHELAHGLVAYWLGDMTAKDEGRLTLNPIKHIDPVLSILVPVMLYLSNAGVIFGGAKPVPVDTRQLKHGVWGMALVAVAGPLMNFLLACIFYIIGYLTGGFYLEMTGPLAGSEIYYGLWGEIVLNMVYVNIALGVFNLIPIPPLDGSRVLYAIAPDAVREMMEKLERYGVLIVFAILLIFPSFFSTVIGWATGGLVTAFRWMVGIF